MVKICLDIFCVFAVKLGVSSTHVQMHYVRAFLVAFLSTGVMIHFLSRLALKAFCVPAGMGWVRSTQFEKHFVFSLEWDWNGQHKLRYNSCFAGMGGSWSTLV